MLRRFLIRRILQMCIVGIFTYHSYCSPSSLICTLPPTGTFEMSNFMAKITRDSFCWASIQMFSCKIWLVAVVASVLQEQIPPSRFEPRAWYGPLPLAQLLRYPPRIVPTGSVLIWNHPLMTILGFPWIPRRRLQRKTWHICCPARTKGRSYKPLPVFSLTCTILLCFAVIHIFDEYIPENTVLQRSKIASGHKSAQNRVELLQTFIDEFFSREQLESLICLVPFLLEFPPQYV